jgi:mono/diheme cytochrome c family protein
MRRLLLACLGLFFATCANDLCAGDAQLGAEVLRRENCLRCHSVRAHEIPSFGQQGEGGNTAPDLSRPMGRRFTPAVLASLMWNHAPVMWASMKDQGIERPQVSEQDGDNLFAYFFSIRFFEKPGEAERGKQVFEAKHCAECHALNQTDGGPGHPVSTWKSLNDPILLVHDMWDHVEAMQNALAERKRGWVTLSGQEMTDLLLYLQNIPQTPKAAAEFSLPDPASGEAAFKATCIGCHSGSMSLETQLSNMTLLDVAAAMWNHIPKMKDAPRTSQEDMRKIVAYIWERQYLGPPGNPGRGARTFEAKRCVVCHNDPQSGAPKLPSGNVGYTTSSMIHVLWTHGPQMLDKMKQKGLAWPHLSADDVSNVVAYLNSRS